MKNYNLISNNERHTGVIAEELICNPILKDYVIDLGENIEARGTKENPVSRYNVNYCELYNNSLVVIKDLLKRVEALERRNS